MKTVNPFRFNYLKTLQAVALLLRQAGPSRSGNYMRLIKLLYIADRISMKETGRPISGDRAVAMPRGPVLSRLLDLIKDRDIQSPQWAEFIQRDGYHIRLVKDPGNGELCPYEVDTLERVWDDYRSNDEWDLVQLTHEFPEWRKNSMGTSSQLISLADILEAVGRGKEVEEVEFDARQTSAFDELFGA